MLYEDSIIDSGKFRGRKLCNVIKKDKKNILHLIKEGFIIDEKVLEKYNIKKNIHSVSGKCVIAEHDNSGLKTKLKVDNIDINSYINEISYYDEEKYEDIDDETLNE